MSENKKKIKIRTSDDELKTGDVVDPGSDVTAETEAAEEAQDSYENAAPAGPAEGIGLHEHENLRDADFSVLDRGEVSEGILIELEQAKRAASENHDKYLRALADFENYKKRALKERSDILKYQGEKVLLDMLEVADNFDFALEHQEGDAQKILEGVRLIQKTFNTILEKWGVRGESGIGKPFNPQHQNALSKVPAEGAAPGTVVSELRKAYYYKDRLLRPGEVVVAAEPEAGAETGGGAEESDAFEEGQQ